MARVSVEAVAYIRFVLSDRNRDSGVADGLFGLARELRDRAEVTAADRETLREALTWFDEHLAEPTRFNRTSSKGHYRRTTKGIAWFRDTATDCIAQMHRLRLVLETNGFHVAMICETRVGYVVYEDELQVVAEPFSDTKTGPA